MTWTSAVDNYAGDLARMGRSPGYVYINRRRLCKMAAGCRWRTTADASTPAVVRWLGELAVSKQTGNQFIALGRAFFDWLTEQGAASDNPFKRVRMARAVEPVRQRRALSAEEVGRLLAVAGEHKLLYWTAVTTGLRRKELSLLRWDEVRTKAIALRAEAQKSRRGDVIPLAAEVAPELEKVRKPDGFVFDKLPSMAEWKAHLKAAGIQFIKDGKRCDFHSLRLTLGTLLARAGVHPKVAQQIMRHSSVLITLKFYTEITADDKAAAIAKLPSFCG